MAAIVITAVVTLDSVGVSKLATLLRMLFHTGFVKMFWLGVVKRILQVVPEAVVYWIFLSAGSSAESAALKKFVIQALQWQESEFPMADVRKLVVTVATSFGVVSGRIMVPDIENTLHLDVKALF